LLPYRALRSPLSEELRGQGVPHEVQPTKRVLEHIVKDLHESPIVLPDGEETHLAFSGGIFANRVVGMFCGAIRLAFAARTKPPDLSRGPLGCFSVFCVPGPAPWAAKAVAGVLPATLGVRAYPPEIHGREIHGHSQFAPDLATRIKLAPLHLR
jgi:hypothetical protein